MLITVRVVASGLYKLPSYSCLCSFQRNSSVRVKVQRRADGRGACFYPQQPRTICLNVGLLADLCIYLCSWVHIMPTVYILCDKHEDHTAYSEHEGEYECSGALMHVYSMCGVCVCVSVGERNGEGQSVCACQSGSWAGLSASRGADVSDVRGKCQSCRTLGGPQGVGTPIVLCLDACHRRHTADVYLVSSGWGMTM